ncbi:hypothetical protein [Variovorax saccharolyticus]|uniref:hypothetical protein n=1 Tax=Variovorax saccharolyticus TaxID=3053516 RepID=UPI002574F962|nr:hypothetical protein [Variovorax sp. J31P216]MDM0024471.1 hypothetical protein [Variovorax sp. J31P216]
MDDETTKAAGPQKAAAVNGTQGKPAPDRGPPAAQQNARSISDPREVATLVMARMNMVNTKKDELTIAIKGLSDVTQQLARAYAQQMLAMEQLARRVKALEATAGAKTGATAAHDQRPQ